MSLFFQPGGRPGAAEVERALAASAQPVHIVHADDAGGLELLCNGLTFDLLGLYPARAVWAPPAGHVYGLPMDIARFGFEPIVLAPTAHIASGASLMLVVRALMELGACLTPALPITALCWNPAQSWMEPRYFGRMIAAWLAEDAFPVLGLIGLADRDRGMLRSTGLAFFTGQELHVPSRPDETGPETVMLAKRIIDHLVHERPLVEPMPFLGPGGEPLIVQPMANGLDLMVVRQA